MWPNSAARAGLRAGDIITEIKGVQFKTNQVQEQVEATPLGQTLQLGQSEWPNCKYHSQTRTIVQHLLKKRCSASSTLRKQNYFFIRKIF